VTAKADQTRHMTGSFDELVLSRMERDPAYRAALHTEALDALRDGDVETARRMLRDYFNEDLPDPMTPTSAVPAS
jgi:DNA-binding GntR family transcriptional regulator